MLGFDIVDKITRIVVIIIAVIIIVKYGTVFEEEYNKKLATLYIYPWWRILIILFVIAATLWCPQVGIIIALVIFFYLNDMNVLLTPLPNF